MKGKEATGLISFGWRRIFTRGGVCSSRLGQRAGAWLCLKRSLALRSKRPGVRAVHHSCRSCTSKQVVCPPRTRTRTRTKCSENGSAGNSSDGRSLSSSSSIFFNYFFFELHIPASSSLRIHSVAESLCFFFILFWRGEGWKSRGRLGRP